MGKQRPMKKDRPDQADAKPKARAKPKPKPKARAKSKPLPEGDGLERLNKYLAECGAASRRGADALISSGRVGVNGQVVAVLGTRIDPHRDRVTLDGKPVYLQRATRTFLLNKPRSVVTTVKDPKASKTLAPWLDRFPERLYPVGRLDRDSEGLLLLTNDGELTQLLTHPRYHIEREYRVTVRGKLTSSMASAMRAGLELEDGPTQPTEVYDIEIEADRSRFSIILREGRSRQIRRMCEQMGLEVIRLKRFRFGPLVMTRMKAGEIRELKESEVKQLRQAAQTPTGEPRHR